MKTALTIAGSDSSGGAGIQADIKTMMANGVYAMSAITALTAQNTTGVAAIQNATPEFLAQEIDSIFTDIEPDAVKVGMVSEKKLIKVISDKLKQYKAKNIVIDPVMVATSGARLINEDAVDTLKKNCFIWQRFLLQIFRSKRRTGPNKNKQLKRYDKGSRKNCKNI